MMTFAEAVETMKAGHAVRRAAWLQSEYIEYRNDLFRRPGGGPAKFDPEAVEATDWRRVDGMDCDAADRVIDHAHDLWTLSQTIQDALDSPGTQVGCRVRLSLAVAKAILKTQEFKGVVVLALRKIANGQVQVDLIWNGDKPRVQTNTSADHSCGCQRT